MVGRFGLRETVTELRLVVTNYGPAGFTFVPDAVLSGVKQIDLVQTFVSGVPTTGGVPDFDYFDMRGSGFVFNIITNDGTSNAIRLYNMGERTRTDMVRTILVSGGTNGQTPGAMNIGFTRPDGSACDGTEFDRVCLEFRVTQLL